MSFSPVSHGLLYMRALIDSPQRIMELPPVLFLLPGTDPFVEPVQRRRNLRDPESVGGEKVLGCWD